MATSSSFSIRSRLLPATFAPLVLALLAVPAVALAQDAEKPRWGATVSFTPSWKGHESLERKGWFGPGLEGSEFTVGLIRGGRHKEFGVSFVRRALKDGLTTVADDECEGDDVDFFCNRTTWVYRSVVLQGVEVHWFIPFVTPTDRVSIGLNVGGGAAFSSTGTIEETYQTYGQFVPFPGQPPIVFEDEPFTFVYDSNSPEGLPLPKVMPLIKAEVQVNIAVTPDLKLRFAGGLNMPSAAAFRLSVAYLLGPR